MSPTLSAFCIGCRSHTGNDDTQGGAMNIDTVRGYNYSTLEIYVPKAHVKYKEYMNTCQRHLQVHVLLALLTLLKEYY